MTLHCRILRGVVMESECRGRLELLAGELSAMAGLGLWIYNAQRDLVYTTSLHEEEYRRLFELGGSRDVLEKTGGDRPCSIYLSDEQGLMWIAERIEDGVVLIGPMFISVNSEKSKTQSLKVLDLSLRERRRLEAALQDVPIVVYSMLEQYAQMLHYMIALEAAPEEHLLYEREELRAHRRNADPDGVGSAEYDDDDAGARGERLLLKAVQEGSRDFIRVMNTELNYSEQLVSRTGNSLRDGKNTMIVFGALCSRSAMNGGLSPRTARALERMYIKRIEACRTITELAELNMQMLNDYVQRVAGCQEKPRMSKSVQECCTYVNAHLGNDLSAGVIASELGYSEYYFTKKFHKEMGVRLTDYIRQQRIEYAKIELVGTDKSIREISEGLHFGTRNYFTSVFRELVGVTPAEYRERAGRI